MKVDPLDFDSFFKDDSGTEGDVTATCESKGRKRSTGHIVLHFSVKKTLSHSCSDSRSCVVSQLRSLRPAALAVFNAVKSKSVQVTVTARDEKQSFIVNPEAKWKRIAQGCGKGSKFVKNRCGELNQFTYIYAYLLPFIIICYKSLNGQVSPISFSVIYKFIHCITF